MGLPNLVFTHQRYGAWCLVHHESILTLYIPLNLFNAYSIDKNKVKIVDYDGF